ncbi:MAG: hypothetical protein C5B54_00775 [Acidobacteria bacterium]|nr:MAG: hypothetical protein C5B54_00775 [Acidobacteriota bacterium]
MNYIRSTTIFDSVSETCAESQLNRIVKSLPEEFHEMLAKESINVPKINVDDSSYFEKLGAASARKNLFTIHQQLIIPGDPQKFLMNCGNILKSYPDFGQQYYVAMGPTSGILTTLRDHGFPATDCLTIMGWYKEGIRICGGTMVKAIEGNCQARGSDCCRCLFSWQMPLASAA